MMLIICSECGKEFSDKCECCPKCGCPISKIDFSKYCNINGIQYDFSDILDLLPQVGENDSDISPIYITGEISRKTQLDWDYAEKLSNIIIQTKSIPNQFNGLIKIRNNGHSNVPKCPKCDSTSITAGQRGYTLLTGFLGSNQTMNRCAC